MHVDRLSDICQHHRAHELLSLFKEGLLLLDDTARDFQQRIVPAFRAFNQPFRFLQIGANKLTVAIVAR